MYIYRERTNERKEWTQERESNGRYHNKRADLYDKQNVISFFAFFDILISSWCACMQVSVVIVDASAIATASAYKKQQQLTYHKMLRSKK